MHGQKHDYNWVFGSYEIRGEDINSDGNIINFNEEIIQIDIFEKEYDMYTSNASYSDSLGKLIFISNGCELYDSNGQILENGDGLNEGETADEFCLGGDLSAYIADSQSMLALPIMDGSGDCYLFHKRAEVEQYFGIGYLLMSIIEKNDEEYIVSDKNILVEDSVDISVLTATKSIDLESWWIIATKRFSNKKLIINLDNEGNLLEKTQAIGKRLSDNNESESYSSFSPDGSKFVIIGEADGLQIFDFNRENGELSNYQFLEAPQDFTGGRAGLAFSSSGRFLYTCHWKKIYQYDMWRADVAESVVVFDWEENYDDLWGFPTPFFRMERGPDCRIYLSAHNSTNTIHVIHHPDQKGVDCGLQQNIRVPAYNIGTLPSYPNYRLGTGEVCDSTKVFPPDLMTAIKQADIKDRSDDAIKLYPNPTTGQVTIEFDSFEKGEVMFQLFDMQGREVYELRNTDVVGSVHIPNIDLQQGMYLYNISKENEILKKGKLVVVR